MLDFIDSSKKMVTSRVRPGVPQTEIQWPLKTHQYAKFLREVKGFTWAALKEELGVPTRTLQSWAEKEVWKKKGADAQELEDFTRTRFLELAARHEMPKSRAVQLLVEGMTKPSITTTVESNGVDKEGKPLPPKTMETPDYGTRHKYQKDYWVLSGLYSTNKQMEFNNAPGGTVNVQVIIPEKVN